jgi:hypothetical protein
MAQTTKKRKVGPRSGRTSTRRIKRDIPLQEVDSSMEKMALSDFAESTKKELKRLGDRIHEAADKSVHLAKDIAGDVQKFARDATDLTRTKIDLHNLRAEREKLYSLMGQHITNLYKENKLTKIKTRFKDDFAKLDELEAAIDEKNKLAERLSLSKYVT